MSGITNVGEVPIKIAEAVNRIGTQIGVRLEIPNDETAHAAQELYVAQQIKRAAESRAETAREEFVKLITAPVHKGKHIVHDSAHATVIADMRSSPRRLVEAKLASSIVKRFNITIEDAQALIDSAKQASDSLVMQLTPALK
jgi:hypothetical protein